MAGNPYDIGENNNPQSENRLYNDANYPPLYNQPYPNQQPYSNQPPTHGNQQPYLPSPRQQEQLIGTVCPSCNQITQSYMVKAVGAITWLWCLGLWILTGCFCWIPFICDSCKEQQIRCAKCHAKKAIL